LDIESIIWLEQFLQSFPGALLMTSHDREFMNRLVSKIAEIDGGEIITYSGDYDFYERERAVRESNQQAAFARQQSMLAKEQRFIDRFRTHAAKAAQVQSRIKTLDKIDKIELPKKRQVVKFVFRVPPRSGDQVAVIEDLHKSYGSRVIYQGFTLTIRRGVPVLGRRCRQADPGTLGRGKIAARHGTDALQPAELPGARRADQSSGPGHQGDAGRGAPGFRRHDDFRVARPHVFAGPRLT